MLLRRALWRTCALALLCLLLFVGSAFAQVAALLPEAFPQFFDNFGSPLAGGTVSFFVAGTSTPQNAYSDTAFAFAVPNPMTLDSAGRPTTSVYLLPASYKIILKSAAGVTIRTADPVTATTLLAQLAVQPAIQTTINTGTLHDFFLTGTIGFGAPDATYGSIVLRCNNASPLTIGGFTYGVDGQHLTVLSVGSADVFLAYQDGFANAANRLLNLQSAGLSTLVAGNGIAEFVYDGTTARWRMTNWSMGGYSSYTPSWTGSVTSPVIGNGSLSARYTVIDRTVFVDMALTYGSTSTAGSGVWSFGLPYAAVDASSLVGGMVGITDSGTGIYSLLPRLNTTTSIDIPAGGGTASFVGASVPMTWAAGDMALIGLSYHIP